MQSKPVRRDPDRFFANVGDGAERVSDVPKTYL